MFDPQILILSEIQQYKIIDIYQPSKNIYKNIPKDKTSRKLF